MVRRGNEDWLRSEDAIRAIETARDSGVPLLGFDGGVLWHPTAVQPSMADSKDYSAPRYPNVPDPYGDAIRFIEDRKDTSLFFTLVFGSQNSN